MACPIFKGHDHCHDPRSRIQATLPHPALARGNASFAAPYPTLPCPALIPTLPFPTLPLVSSLVWIIRAKHRPSVFSVYHHGPWRVFTHNLPQYWTHRSFAPSPKCTDSTSVFNEVPKNAAIVKIGAYTIFSQ